LDGEYAPGASITVLETQSENWLITPEVVTTTTSEQDGTFTVLLPEAGAYTILTRSGDHETETFSIQEEVEFSRATTNFSVELQQAPSDTAPDATPPHMYQASGCWCAVNGRWFDSVCCKGAWNTSCYWTWKGCDNW